MSYYQKYRPERIADLDLGSARLFFEKMMAAGELAHAFLLVGPRGSGKTSSARILARVVNCEKNTKPLSGSPLRKGRERRSLIEPCGECDACISIKNGSAVDVMEIDAASHRGIDDIRDLRDKTRLAPAALNKKVYIIDEVHMLTNEAFNALLKTLEEPPPHVMFILCTTEAHKVPETVASRCVRVSFTKAGPKELVASLTRAVAGEGIKIDKEALELLAESVDGSFREGHKLLEQLALNQGKITSECVRENLSLLGLGGLDKIIGMVRSGDSAGIVSTVKSWEESGSQVTAIITSLLGILQSSVHKTVQTNGKLDPVDGLLIKKLIKVVPKVKMSPLPFLPLELALLELAFKRGSKTKEVRIKNQEVRNTSEEKIEKTEPVETVGDNTPNARGAVSFEQVEGGWHELLSRLAPRNHSVAGLLRSAKPKELDDRFLTIEVFYKFHKEQLDQEARRKMIEEEIAKMWGPISVRCVLGEHGGVHQVNVPRSAVVPAGGGDDLKAAEEVFGV